MVGVIDETGKVASKTQVNRTRHQLHDLVARASVVENPDSPSLYGLGDKQAVRVTLRFRDGTEESFLAGDPNPSGVSYYMQREGDPAIYTVKKSAVDYFSLDLEDFRERRFAGFNAKDVDRLHAQLPDQTLTIQRTGEKQWEMVAPNPGMAVSLDKARALLGRISVLKETGDFGVELGRCRPRFGRVRAPGAQGDLHHQLWYSGAHDPLRGGRGGGTGLPAPCLGARAG